MNTSNITSFVKRVGLELKRYSPTILTGIGVGGMITTVIMAVKATPKATQLLLNAEEQKGDELTNVEKVKVVLPVYWPAAAVGVGTITCFICANSTNLRRQAALASAYSLSENTLKEYQNKVLDTIGKRKEKSIRDELAKDHLNSNPLNDEQQVIIAGGETLCYEEITGRYFKSDIEKIRKVENEINKELLQTGYITLNQIYYELGLKPINIGDDLGWNAENGLIEFDYSSQLTSNSVPCLVINFKIQPIGSFRNWY